METLPYNISTVLEVSIKGRVFQRGDAIEIPRLSKKIMKIGYTDPPEGFKSVANLTRSDAMYTCQKIRKAFHFIF